MSDPEVLLPTNKLFFFPFMAAGPTCSMMLHIQILTFIFHQSFLPYYIKKQLRAKMWPQTPLSDFLFNYYSVLAGLAWNLIQHYSWVDTGSRHLWLLQHFSTLELSSILFIRKSRAVDVDEWWDSVVFVFACCCCCCCVIRPSLPQSSKGCHGRHCQIWSVLLPVYSPPPASSFLVSPHQNKSSVLAANQNSSDNSIKRHKDVTGLFVFAGKKFGQKKKKSAHKNKRMLTSEPKS